MNKNCTKILMNIKRKVEEKMNNRSFSINTPIRHVFMKKNKFEETYSDLIEEKIIKYNYYVAFERADIYLTDKGLELIETLINFSKEL